MNWTDEQVTELGRLWNVERLTCGQIAAAMKITRNAVIGKIHRTGLAGRTHKAVPGRTHKARVPYKPPGGHRAEPPAPEVKRLPVVNAERKTEVKPKVSKPVPTNIFDLKPGQCHWPTWADREPLLERFFCGAQAAGGTYCETHRKIAGRAYVAGMSL